MPRSIQQGQGTWTKQRTRVRLATRDMVNNMSSSAPKTQRGRETRSCVQVIRLFVIHNSVNSVLLLKLLIVFMADIMNASNLIPTVNNIT